MGDKIKTAVELAMEKLDQIEDLSREEKEEIETKKKLYPVMADFYGNKISGEDLWKKLKKEPRAMVVEAQRNIIDSIRFGIAESESKRRKDAILALETLKTDNKSSFIDQSLSYLENLQKKSLQEKESAFNSLKDSLENNPEALYKEIKQNGRKMMVQLSIEDAISQNPQWQKFLSDHQERYGQEFIRVIDELKSEIK